MNGADFNPRDARIYRPYPDEIPWELLRETPGVADSEHDLELPDSALVRIARVGQRLAGVYAVVAETPLCYRIVTLVVSPAFRHRGLGRWLLGHAIGLSESRGARRIVVARRGRQRLFTAAGFAPCNGDLTLDLTPE